jgi:hypothetical protein
MFTAVHATYSFYSSEPCRSLVQSCSINPNKFMKERGARDDQGTCPRLVSRDLSRVRLT